MQPDTCHYLPTCRSLLIPINITSICIILKKYRCYWCLVHITREAKKDSCLKPYFSEYSTKYSEIIGRLWRSSKSSAVSIPRNPQDVYSSHFCLANIITFLCSSDFLQLWCLMGNKQFRIDLIVTLVSNN